MGSRHAVTETERSLQYRALRHLALNIPKAENEKPKAQALLKGLLMLTYRKVSSQHQ